MSKTNAHRHYGTSRNIEPGGQEAKVKASGRHVWRISLDMAGPGRQIPEDFLSYTIDTSVLIGGRWWGESRGLEQGLSRDRTQALDLENPRLTELASALAPALLRVGGTEADRIRYGFARESDRLAGLFGMPAQSDREDRPASMTEPSGGVEPMLADQGSFRGGPPGQGPVTDEVFILRKGLWKKLCRFTRHIGAKLVFTLAMGPETRDEEGNWQPDDALRLVSWSLRKDAPVHAWELGNEVNAFPLIYGRRQGLSPAKYAREFGFFAALMRKAAPEAVLAGPSSAVWPFLGEIHPMIPGLCAHPVSKELDVVSFHYYPQQSDRGRYAVRRAHEETLLSSRRLEGLGTAIRRIAKHVRASGNPQAGIWISEMGHALYGGQQGISDTWASSLWWLDQLCLAACSGVERVFRQSLVGGDYGLLGEGSFEPRPDWFVSALWKSLVGRKVFGRPGVEGPDRKVRAWHLGGRKDTGWLVLINLHPRRSCPVGLPAEATGRVLTMEGDGGLLARKVKLNGRPLDESTVLSGRNWPERFLDARDRPGVKPAGTGAGNKLAGTLDGSTLTLFLPPLACAWVELSGGPEGT